MLVTLFSARIIYGLHRINISLHTLGHFLAYLSKVAQVLQVERSGIGLTSAIRCYVWHCASFSYVLLRLIRFCLANYHCSTYEYIAVIDVKPYASDMECFVPLMEKFNRTYGHYPKYPVADAGYGSYNNYLYCEEHGMEKYMKFTMYKKETTDKKYHENPYRAVNFAKDADGNLLCPNGRKFLFKRTQHVKYNKYGRTEELYECESCEGCQHKQECCPRAHKNRTIRMNQELTAIHQEVLQNLESIHGALLRMNRSIQSEG